MTKLEQITFVAPLVESEAKFFAYDDFISRLSQAAKVPVVVVADDGKLPEPRGPILLNRYGAIVKQLGSTNLDSLIETFTQVWPESLRPLLFCLNGDRGEDALTLLGSLGLAGSVDLHDYRIGIDPERMGKGPHNQSGLYGLRDAITANGGAVEYEKGRYCKTTCAPFPDLPSLLVGYFDAYWKIAGR